MKTKNNARFKKLIISLFLINFLFSLSVFSVRATPAQSDNIKILYREQKEPISVFNHKNEKIYLSDNDLYLMAQVVYAESIGEPYEGKVAVASVIINRLKDRSFPMTVEGVIKQKSAFSCVRNGKIGVVPNKDCFNAVLDALNGTDPTSEALFYYNPEIATCNWMKNVKKSNMKTIGNHVFFVAQ